MDTDSGWISFIRYYPKGMDILEQYHLPREFRNGMRELENIVKGIGKNT